MHKAEPAMVDSPAKSRFFRRIMLAKPRAGLI